MNYQNRYFVWVVFIPLIAIGQAFTQVHTAMEDRSFQSGSIRMMYRLFVPENYDPSEKYPFLVVMHGVGEKGDDNTIQVDHEDLASTWIADSLQNRVPHFVMGPQCPSNNSWGGSAINTVHEIIDSLKREFSLDTNRLYAAGLSMGARGVFNLLQSRPGYFAAALACAGAGNNNGAADIARTPLWAFHAEGDKIVNVSGTRSMVEAIENTGIRFVRFMSESWTNGPGLNTYSNAILGGTDPLDIVAKNPSGISYDSLQSAVNNGAEYLYSEVIGGDHRTGWMVAFHHPLVPHWIFSKTKEQPVATFRSPSWVLENSGKADVLLFQNLSENFTQLIYSLQGRKINLGKRENNRRFERLPVIAVER